MRSSNDTSGRKKARLLSAEMSVDSIMDDDDMDDVNEQSEDYDTKWEPFLQATGENKGIVAELLKLRENSVYMNGSNESRLFYLQINYHLSREHGEMALELLGDSVGEVLNVGRGPNILDGLDTELAHSFDLNEFSRRVNSLFDWHDNATVRKKYVAPYFTLVQSSGMGKTKLLMEFRNALGKNPENSDIRCLTILCIDIFNNDEKKRKQYFDHTLVYDPREKDIVDFVWAKLDKMLEPFQECKRLVLLFDEAQGLMNGKDANRRGSLMFRAIRWWLREERKTQVVATFAGTTAKLSNFYPPDPPQEQASRNKKRNYKNYQKNETDDKKLYPPFFELNTIACFKEQRSFDDTIDPGFPQASVFGRPLFAYYQRHQELTNEKLKQFACRLVLSVNEYENNLLSCYSVLGSRVQMGNVNSFDALSSLVASGYSCLVEFQNGDPGAVSTTVARLAFMPDPLCATLAMKYMVAREWKELGFSGKPGTFWVNQAARAFSSRLCLPEKGDVGEIFVALYVLLCGDILRSNHDTEMNSFSVPLDIWFRLVKNGGNPVSAPAGEPMSSTLASQTIEFVSGVMTRGQSKHLQNMGHAKKNLSKCSVSFVQVCRNDYRADSFCEENVLKHMYFSGVANYAYRNCKAIDIAASIAVVQELQTSYHPLLISVKNWSVVTKGDVIGWVASLSAFLMEMREKQDAPASAVCLVILLGCSDPPDMEGDSLNSDSLLPFPVGDVYRLVIVPQTDAFGVSKAISELGTVTEKSEIYSSHGFLGREKTADSLLRKKSKNQELVSELFRALRASDEKSA